MSLYNMMFGYNPAVFLLLPMLGRPKEAYPRFRDCFITEDEKHILIYTRVGGGNRNCGYGEEELLKDPNFIRTFDDDYDSTFGYYEFAVPEKWQKDFEAIKAGGALNASVEYIEYLIGFWKNNTDLVKALTKVLEDIKKK